VASSSSSLIGLRPEEAATYRVTCSTLRVGAASRARPPLVLRV